MMKEQNNIQKQYVKRKYTSKELLRMLKMKARELGEAPFIREINCDDRLPSATTYMKRFGSFSNALKKAGLKTKTIICYDCKEALKSLRDKAKVLDRAPTRREVNADTNMPSSGVYIRCFGSFRKALLEAGYLPKGERSDQDLLRLFKEKSKELGRSPTRKEIVRDRRLPSLELYCKRFGSIREVQKRLGIKPNTPRYHNKAELIEMLRIKAKQLGKPPTRRDIDKDKVLPTAYIYYKFFGSLQKARELAGCPSSFVYHRYTETGLLKMLRKKVKSLGRMPYAREINADEKMPCGVTYTHKFGSMQNLRQMMGFLTQKKIKKREKYLKKTGEYDVPKILNYLRKKTQRLGRLPSWEEFSLDPNIPSWEILIKLFGHSYEIAKLIGISLPKKTYTFRYLTKQGLKREIIKFYKKQKKIPTSMEFRNSPETPPMSLIRREKLTWNQILDECGLPIHSRGSISLNREAEMVIKNMLLSSRHKVEDLTIKNALSPYSLRVDGKIRIHVSGSTRHETSKKYNYVFWAFRVPRRKEFDYMVGVGFDEKIKAEAVYVFPVDTLWQKAIRTSVAGGKYSQFWLKHFSQLSEALGISKRKRFRR